MSILQDERLNDRLKEAGRFLLELTRKKDVDGELVHNEVDLQRLRRLAAFLSPEEVEADNDDAFGLNRWAVSNWAKRPRQTGMEQENERIVLALLNWYSDHSIPFYILDQRGEKTGREYGAFERLKMLQTKVTETMRAERVSHELAMKAERRVQAYQVAHAAAVAALGESTEKDRAAARAKIILEALEKPEELAIYGAPDDRGVRRVVLDARGLVLQRGMHRLVHDLRADQALCKTCLGLGVVKVGGSYGLGDRKPHEDHFPYHDQWLRSCNDCYMGVANLCKHCQQVIPRHRTRCECPATFSELRDQEWAKEQERRKTLKRISLTAYDHPMLWCDECHDYVMVDLIDEHREGCFDDADHRPRVECPFFACEPSEPLTWIDAADYIETLQNRATEQASPEDGDDVLDFTKEAESELEAYLKAWAMRNVVPRDLYYPNMNLIVEVPHGEVDDPDAVRAVRPDDGAREDGASAAGDDLRGGAPPGDDPAA